MSNWSSLNSKQLSFSDLKGYSEKIKAEGKTIIFTNGCFDILHKGHVEYLAKSADKGDVLIVGLNSDDSVKRQGKGENRPINDISSRMTVLSALFFVDAVVEFDEDTPLELIKEIQPDVLVKGGDYDPCETNMANKKYIVGKAEVEKNGGRVEVVNLVQGYSTTNVINKIKKGNL